MSQEPRDGAAAKSCPGLRTPGGVPRPRGRLTRRELLAGAAALAVAGCAPPFAARDATPTPTLSATPFALDRAATLAAGAGVPAALVARAATLLAGVAGIPSVTPATAAHPPVAQSADLVLTYGPLPAGYVGAVAGASPATLLTHLRVPVDGVPATQARQLLGGQLADWHGAGAPSALSVHPLALAGLALPGGVALTSSARILPDAAALLDLLTSTPGSLALVPLELANWTVRNLGVDGIYPAQGRGDLAANPLGMFSLTLGARVDLVKRGLSVAALAAASAPVLAVAQPVLDLAAVGDIMLGRTVNFKMVSHGDYRYPYRQMHDELQRADLRVANLECTVTDTVAVPSDPYTFTFVSSKRAVTGLTYAGFDVLTVANNHADGSGNAALLDMLATLRDNGIIPCGGGRNLADARAAAVVTRKGTRVAFLGYDMVPPQGSFAGDTSGGLAPVNLTTLPADIATARTRADIVIPYFHWGIEYTKDPTVDQQRVAHAAIEAGADLVLGNHPHWIQGIENYRGRLIIYSFGNFIFDQSWSRPTLEGLLIHFYWRGGSLVAVRFVPTLDEDQCQPRVMSQSEAADSFARLWSGTDLLASGHFGPEAE
ncbi:MAG: CapA family protein [Ktedonobacterales bacterium]